MERVPDTNGAVKNISRFLNNIGHGQCSKDGPGDFLEKRTMKREKYPKLGGGFRTFLSVEKAIQLL